MDKDEWIVDKLDP